MRWGFLVLVAAMLATPCASTARDAPAFDLFPPAVTTGSGWTTARVTDEDVSGWPALERHSGAVYSGPAGEHVRIERIAVNPGADHHVSAWITANSLFTRYREDFLPQQGSDTTAFGADAMAGCEKLRHVDGVDAVIPDVPVGMSLCFADETLIVLAYVSGKVGDLTGHAASDQVIALMLAHKT